MITCGIKEATKELNALYKELGNTAGVKAEAGVAKAAAALNEYWDKATSGARVQASKILMQVLELGRTYIPLVAHAAEQNFSITNKTLKPFFDWLKGPEAMGIFLQLEREFRDEIPTAMHAVDMAFQLLAKTISFTAPLTGKFLQSLNDFLTKLNTPAGFAKWEAMMDRMIRDFHVWGAFIKELGGALVDLFRLDAHTGETIIETLTEMLHKVREYEKSVTGAANIRNIFLVHREEIVALLKVLPPLISSFTHIYTTVAPPLVKAVTAVANAFANILNTLEKASPVFTWAIGLTLIAAKLKVLTPLLTAFKAELLGTAAAEDKAAAGATLDADATTAYARAATSAEAATAMEELGILGTAGGTGLAAKAKGAGAVVAGGLPSKATLLKAGLAAGTGALIANLGAGALGIHGTTNTALTAAGAGAGLGLEFGGPFGAAAGAALGAGLVESIRAFTVHAPDYGKTFAQNFVSGIGTLLGPELEARYKAAIAKPLSAAHFAEHPKESVGQQALSYAKYLPLGIGSAANLVNNLLGTPKPNAAKAKAEYEKAGREAGQGFIEGEQHTKFRSAGFLYLAAVEQLDQLPPKARLSAAKAMIAYAQELETRGELAKGSVAHIITGLESQFPNLANYLKSQGESMASQFAKALEMQEAQGTLKNTLAQISEQFGIAFNPHGKPLSEAERMLHQMALVFPSASPELKAAIEQWSSVLKHQVEIGWVQAQNATKEGISVVNKELETELGALGAGKEIKAGLVHGKTGSEGVNLRENPLTGKGAQGGLWQIGSPNAAGRDTVGLNIRVGEGEQVAVFNRHQLPIVNAALAGMGGLPGLFSNVNTPHYMAQGGLIGAVVSAGDADIKKAAKAKLAASHPAGPSGGGHGGGGIGHYSGSWVQVMRQIAKAKGWSLPAWEGVIADESGGIVSNQNPTSTAFGLGQLESMNWPTYGGGPGSSGVEQIEAMARYIAAVYGNPSNALAHEGAYHWYTRGGLPGFTTGGLAPVLFTPSATYRRGPGGSVVITHPKSAPKQHKINPFGKIPPLSFSSAYTGPFGKLESLLGEGGDVARLQEEYEIDSQQDTLALARAPHEGQFVYTPQSEGGGRATPEILHENVALRIGQLHILSAKQEGVLGDLYSASTLTSGVIKTLKDMIHERQKAITQIKHRIEANIRRIIQLHKERHDLEVKIAALRASKHTTGIAALSAQVHTKALAITAIEEENQRLGGNTTEVPDTPEMRVP